ncbi:hypothetical protein Tco_1056075 [Tanacetum coccineum]|uniref:Copia protein n=1 Tax=Tanacetum coccineum TaxID=301880 RepID=A0ABQ5H1H1_9ASTR
MKVKESLNVTFDKTPPPSKTSPLEDDDLVEEEAIEKQTALAISTTEAEYVGAGKACQQALWMKQDLVDYGIRLDDIPIMCDNKGSIDLRKNPVQHSRTKHIEIRHHFLRDNVQKGNISIEKVSSEDNIADILTKPLKCEPFNYLHLGDDDEDDGDSRATPSPTTYLNSLKPLNHQQYDIPTSSEQDDDLLFERQTDFLNQTQQMHKELRGGFKSFGKALRGVFGKKKK